MKTQKLDKSCEDILNNRLQDEYTANHTYRCFSNYFRMVGYEGAASYFAKEAEDELKHAKMIEDYMTDWGVIPNPKINFKTPTLTGLKDGFSQGYELELNLLNAYNADALAVLDEDSSLFTFLQTFLKIQDESVREYATKLNQLDLLGDDKFALYFYDSQLLGD